MPVVQDAVVQHLDRAHGLLVCPEVHHTDAFGRAVVIQEHTGKLNVPNLGEVVLQCLPVCAVGQVPNEDPADLLWRESVVCRLLLQLHRLWRWPLLVTAVNIKLDRDQASIQDGLMKCGRCVDGLLMRGKIHQAHALGRLVWILQHAGKLHSACSLEVVLQTLPRRGKGQVAHENTRDVLWRQSHSFGRHPGRERGLCRNSLPRIQICRGLRHGESAVVNVGAHCHGPLRVSTQVELHHDVPPI
mmetsp:Transcript_20162/g.47199  ORF Transcript_20162/g.47199 Transcript_20162/m.47199 type:complete len:244 (-) Transcript_20162:155-886(-)